MEADSIRDEGRTAALIGTALVMNRPRDVVVRRVPASVEVVEVVDGDGPRLTAHAACLRRICSWRRARAREHFRLLQEAVGLIG